MPIWCIQHPSKFNFSLVMGKLQISVGQGKIPHQITIGGSPDSLIKSEANKVQSPETKRQSAHPSPPHGSRKTSMQDEIEAPSSSSQTVFGIRISTLTVLLAAAQEIKQYPGENVPQKESRHRSVPCPPCHSRRTDRHTAARSNYRTFREQ